MKILYINSHSADYVQDLTYAGLVKLLGRSNVIDFLWNPKFHVAYKRYPKNLGYTRHSLLPSLLARRNRDFDLVMVGASKVDCFETYLEIIDRIPARVPVVFIDGGDRWEIGGDLAVYRRPELYQEALARRPFDWIFKREYLINEDHGPKVFPLPMSFNLDRLPRTLPREHRYQVSFWAVESHPVRVQALDLLSDRYDCRDNGTMRNQKFSRYKRRGTFYLEELARCRVVLNLRGGGWDTMRYWEAPAVARFMITQSPQIIIPHDFEHGRHVVHCRHDLADLTELCDYYLHHEAERERIAAAGHAHLRTHHTDVARARYILSKIT